MLIRADFSLPAAVPYEAADWQPSPMAGVERLMLDRVGAEKARATSLVRYAPGSRFSEHQHDAGEEFLVLEGVFSDASGDFPPGTYVRNPPGSAHSPWSEPGCVIFVKLRQFDLADLARVVVDPRASEWESRDGVRVLALHHFDPERVDLVELPEGAAFAAGSDSGGMECLVLEGCVALEGKRLGAWSWARVPAGGTSLFRAVQPSRIYRKRGHLAHARGACPE